MKPKQIAFGSLIALALSPMILSAQGRPAATRQSPPLTRDQREDIRDRREDVRDRREDVIDRREDVRDRREDVRDRRDGNTGPADRREDVRDRREDVRDRREDVRDRREDVRDRLEDRIDRDPRFARRMHDLLPPKTSLQDAVKGFNNQNQFIAALHASKNLNIPFADIQAKMASDPDMTLGRAIKELRPELKDDAVQKAALRAEKQAGETEKAS